MFSWTRETLPLYIAVCFLLHLPVAARAEQPLRWEFTEGEQYTLVLHESIEDRDDDGGISFQRSGDITLHFHWQVVDLDDAGTATIELTYERIVMNSQGELRGQSFHFDTSEDQETEELDVFESSLAALIGKSLQLTLNNRGGIDAMTSSDEVLQVIEDSDPLNNVDWFGGERLPRVLGRCLLCLPEEELATGQTWRLPVEVAGLLARQLQEVHYTRAEDLQQPQATLAQFEITGSSRTTATPEDHELQPIEQVFLEAAEFDRIQADGGFTFNLQAGHLAESSLMHEIEYHLGGPSGGTVTMETHAVTTLTLTPVE